MKTNQFNVNTLLIVAGIAGLFWFQNKKNDDGTTPAPKPVVVSITKAYEDGVKADRLAKIRLLKELAEKDFANDKVKGDWFDLELDKRRQVAYESYRVLVGTAIKNGTTRELAEKWEAGK